MTIQEHNGSLKVQEILAKHAEDVKSTQVIKEFPVQLDLGNLTADDVNPLDNSKLKKGGNKTEYLQSIARDATQAIINNVYQLERQSIDDIQFAILPAPSTKLPREKPIPKPKAPTKWEQYAAEKGIKKRKKENKVWDEYVQDFVPKYGRHKVQIEKEKNWMMEVSRHADPYEDPFKKAAEAKKDRVAKNEFQRLRNLSRNAKDGDMPGTGVLRSDTKDVDHLKKAMHFSRYATASMGKFQPTLKNEMDIKGFKKDSLKRNEMPFKGNTKDERKTALKIIDKIQKPRVNAESNVIKEIEKEMNMKEAAEKKYLAKSGRRAKHGNRRDGKSGAALASLTGGKVGDKNSLKRYRKANEDSNDGPARKKAKKGGHQKLNKSVFGGAVGRRGQSRMNAAIKAAKSGGGKLKKRK